VAAVARKADQLLSWPMRQQAVAAIEA